MHVVKAIRYLFRRPDIEDSAQSPAHQDADLASGRVARRHKTNVEGFYFLTNLYNYDGTSKGRCRLNWLEYWIVSIWQPRSWGFTMQYLSECNPNNGAKVRPPCPLLQETRVKHWHGLVIWTEMLFAYCRALESSKSVFSGREFIIHSTSQLWSKHSDRLSSRVAVITPRYKM
jgi:hypothetical protein